jgi:hypothetical protein
MFTTYASRSKTVIAAEKLTKGAKEILALFGEQEKIELDAIPNRMMNKDLQILIAKKYVRTAGNNSVVRLVKAQKNTKIVKNENGTYNLVDADTGEIYVKDESMTVVSNIKESLDWGSSGISEMDEVADTIREGSYKKADILPENSKVEIEMEHKPLFKKIEKDVAEDGKLDLTEKEMAKEIVVNHEDEHKKYYDKKEGLPAMEKRLENKEAAAQYVEIAPSLYINRIGTDSNGNWSYWVSWGSMPSKKIHHMDAVGELNPVRHIENFQEPDKNTQAVINGIVAFMERNYPYKKEKGRNND